MTNPEDLNAIISEGPAKAYSHFFIAYESGEKEKVATLGALIIEKYPDSKEAKWARERTNELCKGQLPIKWLNFYTYVRLPLGLLISIGAVFESKQLPYYNLLLLLTVLYSALILFVIIGIHKRHIWGWKLNWILIAVESLLFPIECAGNFLLLITLVGLAWVWPNYIYFNKRRYLFS